MRTVKAFLVIATAVLGLVGFTAPASAATLIAYHADGDNARYDQATNVLTICDNSAGNGTAKAVLQVIGGNTKELFDTNGANHGCNTATLNVDNNKQGYLSVCPDASGFSCASIASPFWL